jgi:hypothetical protein
MVEIAACKHEDFMLASMLIDGSPTKTNISLCWSSYFLYCLDSQLYCQLPGLQNVAVADEPSYIPISELGCCLVCIQSICNTITPETWENASFSQLEWQIHDWLWVTQTWENAAFRQLERQVCGWNGVLWSDSTAAGLYSNSSGEQQQLMVEIAPHIPVGMVQARNMSHGSPTETRY